MAIQPRVVSTAESFCSHVLFIPTTAIGRTPQRVGNTDEYGVSAEKIAPGWCDIPLLWTLAQRCQGLIPTVGGNKNIEGRRMEELIYTSAASGLEPGTSGYCTVAKTKSLPAAIARRLESLSAHRAGQSEDRRTRLHVITKLGPRRLHTLSSIVSSGLDYSGRPNKLAHHVLIDSSEVTAGPVQLLTSRELHTTTWSGQPRHLDTRSPPVPKRKSKGKSLWKKLLGDEVWLHYLSERVVAGQTTYLVYPESVEVLPLLFELEQQLDDPWQLTFSTNYAAMPPDVQCLVRCVPADDAGTLRLHSRSATEVLDLTNPQLPPARSYEAVEISFPPKPPPLERTLEETVQTNFGARH